jgi:Reverse transcriptase (RNA-dependent DNA polymerase)
MQKRTTYSRPASQRSYSSFVPRSDIIYRIFPEYFQTDSATAQFAAIRLFLSLAVLLNLRLSSIDMYGAYLQADPRTRDIFVRPPFRWTSPNIVWKLLRPAYRLAESGRLWQISIERWLSEYGVEEVPGLSQFFILRCSSGPITPLLAKVVVDLLLAGYVSKMTYFCTAL